MSGVSEFVNAQLKFLLERVPVPVLEKVEDLVQRQLGKGSGAWSTKNEARAVAGFAKSLLIKKVVAIDAGANIGNWTSELLEYLPDAEVIAFEPSENAFASLQNKFSTDGRVTIVNLALGKENKSGFLYADKGGSGLGSLTKRRVDHFEINFEHQEEITIQTLDDWIALEKLEHSPNVLKMDVEGHEFDVLLGAVKAIETLRIIQFEFGGSNIDSRTFFQDFWYFFKINEFVIYRLTPTKPILVKKYSERDETFSATNYIAVRKNAS